MGGGGWGGGRGGERGGKRKIRRCDNSWTDKHKTLN